MKRNGFTLVELLATIVIIAVIALMGSIGIAAAKKGINQSLWNSNVELIEASAESFGTDKKAYIKNLNKSCKIGDATINHCLDITVQTLINTGYLNTKDYINNYDGQDNYKVVINKTIEKDDNENNNFINGYYVNNVIIYVYVENDIVYANYSGILQN